MKVQFYKATDGTLFDTHAAYVAKEQELRTIAAAEALVANTVSHEGLNTSEVGPWIAKNAAALRTMLNDALVTKRTPKAAAPAAAVNAAA